MINVVKQITGVKFEHFKDYNLINHGISVTFNYNNIK